MQFSNKCSEDGWKYICFGLGHFFQNQIREIASSDLTESGVTGKWKIKEAPPSLNNTAAAGLKWRTNNFNARCRKLLPAVGTCVIRMMAWGTTTRVAGTDGSRVESHPRISAAAGRGGGGGGGAKGTRVHSHPLKLILWGERVVWGIQGAGGAACNTVLGSSPLQVRQSTWVKMMWCRISSAMSTLRYSAWPWQSTRVILIEQSLTLTILHALKLLHWFCNCFCFCSRTFPSHV